MGTYAKELKKILSPAEARMLAKLSTPQKIQDYLDTLSINFEESGGETLMSPRRVLRTKKAHCIEGALLAAAALAYHGSPPLLMDFVTVPADEDHVITLFKQNNLWGALSKTNHAVLRYRDPVYKTIRELAMSYFHEYFEWNGKKSLRTYSKPFDLRQYKPEQWITAEENLFWLGEEDLNNSSHFPIIPKIMIQKLRHVSPIELRSMKLTEWKKKK